MDTWSLAVGAAWGGFGGETPTPLPVFSICFMFKVQDVKFLFKLSVSAATPSACYHAVPILIDFAPLELYAPINPALPSMSCLDYDILSKQQESN